MLNLEILFVTLFSFSVEKGHVLVLNGASLCDIWFLSSGSIEAEIDTKNVVINAPCVFGDNGFLQYFLLFNPKDVSEFI